MSSAALPLSYVVPELTARTAHINAFRPETLLSLDDVPPYILGLFYIPFVLLGAFALYLVLLVVLCVCRHRRGIRPAVGCCEANRGWRECWLWLFIVLAVCAFAASIAMAALICVNAGIISSQLDGLSHVFHNLSDEVRIFAQSSLQLQAQSAAITCAAQPLLQGTVRQALGQLSIQLVSAATSAASKLVVVDSDFNSTRDAINHYLFAQSVTTIVLSSVMFVLCALLPFLLLWMLRSRRRAQQSVYAAVQNGGGGGGNVSMTTRRACCGGSCGTCEGGGCGGCGNSIWCFCTPGGLCSLLLIIILLVLCAATHMIALAITDVCYPQVNDNLNVLVGEANDYTVPSRENSCASIVNSGTAQNAPALLNTLCYLQTCQNIDLVLPQFTNLPAALAALATASAEIPSGACDNTQQILGSAQAIGVAAQRSQFYLSCEQLNPRYADLVYTSLCDKHVQWSLLLFAFWVAAASCLMAAHLVWVFVTGAVETDLVRTSVPKPYNGQHLDPVPAQYA